MNLLLIETDEIDEMEDVFLYRVPQCDLLRRGVSIKRMGPARSRNVYRKHSKFGVKKET